MGKSLQSAGRASGNRPFACVTGQLPGRAGLRGAPHGKRKRTYRGDEAPVVRRGIRGPVQRGGQLGASLGVQQREERGRPAAHGAQSGAEQAECVSSERR